MSLRFTILCVVICLAGQLLYWFIAGTVPLHTTVDRMFFQAWALLVAYLTSKTTQIYHAA